MYKMVTSASVPASVWEVAVVDVDMRVGWSRSYVDVNVEDRKNQNG